MERFVPGNFKSALNQISGPCVFKLGHRIRETGQHPWLMPTPKQMQERAATPPIGRSSTFNQLTNLNCKALDLKRLG